jgi:hypothetical protein
MTRRKMTMFDLHVPPQTEPVERIAALEAGRDAEVERLRQWADEPTRVVGTITPHAEAWMEGHEAAKAHVRDALAKRRDG